MAMYGYVSLPEGNHQIHSDPALELPLNPAPASHSAVASVASSKALRMASPAQ